MQQGPSRVRVCAVCDFSKLINLCLLIMVNKLFIEWRLASINSNLHFGKKWFSELDPMQLKTNY